jgi:signal transduction histidine kinase
MYNRETPLPDYFKVSKEIPVDFKTWQIIGKQGRYFLLLNTKKLDDKVNKYAFFLFVWEMPILALTVLIVYKTVNIFLKREQETKELVKLFFLLFTHKLGNFLSLNKLNLEMLLSKYGHERSLLRLKRSYEILEEDFKRSLNYIRSVEEEEREEWIDISEVIEKLFCKYHSLFPNKKVELSLKPLKIRAKKGEVENFFQLLIENAFKYSQSFVEIKVTDEKNGYKIILVNDVGNTPSGTGIGLKLVEFLAKKIGCKVKFFPGKRLFTVEIKL